MDCGGMIYGARTTVCGQKKYAALCFPVQHDPLLTH